MKSALDHKLFDRTSAPPTRRVIPEKHQMPSPEAPTQPIKEEPETSTEPSTGPAAALLILLLLLLWLFGSDVAQATTTFSFTNDVAVPVTTMFYTNTPSGYVFYNATNTLNGTSNTLSTSFAVQGVAVQATNSDLARLAPFASLPAGGSAVSLIFSNTAYFSAGVPKNTTQFGTNIAAGQLYTTAVGTNLNSNASFNTNLP